MTREEKRLYDIEYRAKHKDRYKAYRNKPHIKNEYYKRALIQRDKQRAVRLKLIDMFGDACKDCRYTYHPHMYEFHHRLPSEKKFTLGMSQMSKKWEAIIVEASKTDMLCCNCHRARHILMKQEGRTND